MVIYYIIVHCSDGHSDTSMSTPNRLFQFHLEERWGMDVQGGKKVRALYCGVYTAS